MRIYWSPLGIIFFLTCLFGCGSGDGEMGEGGLDYEYFVLRFLISDFTDYFPGGNTLDYGGWSEAESNLYHHYAFYPMVPGTFYVQP